MRCPSLLCSSCSKNKLKGTFCGSKHFPEVPAQSGLSPPCPFLPPVGHYFHLNSVLCPVLTSSAYILSNSLKNKVDPPTYLLMHPRYTSSLQKNREKENNHLSFKYYNHCCHFGVFLSTLFHLSLLLAVMMT